MGNGIAHVFAQQGYKVCLIDISEDLLKKGLATIDKNMSRQVEKGSMTEEKKKAALASISTTTFLKEGVKEADLVIEAATENIDLKLKIFREMDECTKPGTILASNTSLLSVTEIASVTYRPKKILGVRFVHPVHEMKRLELVRALETDDETVAACKEVVRRMGKEVVIAKDYLDRH